ncbi:MAG: aminomethyl-transferring glycine dehydrogenase [Bacteroidales bacterium]|jgi:glycine dehydrogenase|nr:aminomethyl-transferring glycine dehydrogenase [Bacteroidales bacterium]
MATDKFSARHIGPRDSELGQMLETIGVGSVNELIDQTVPKDIRLPEPLKLDPALSEMEYAAKIKEIASKNKIFKSFIGMGYYGTATPAVIFRNIFENPSWYTSYTPYQAEISQGRLEALLNYQTVVSSLTGMELANSSLLDEGTGAAEAMIMMFNSRSRKDVKAGKNVCFIDKNIFPQTLDVVITRAEPLGIEVVVDDFNNDIDLTNAFGVIVQYPAANGEIVDYSAFTAKVHEAGAMVTVVADLLSLAMLTPPGEWGADVVTGTTQRFGIPMGYGGPHAAYFATHEKYKRTVPGRIIGVSVDRYGNKALRMALQTREQHIKREKATSNICTAQALLATMAGMYAVYHGPEGIKRIAGDTHAAAVTISTELTKLGFTQNNKSFFDTIEFTTDKVDAIRTLALDKEINLCYVDEKTIRISTDETTLIDDINNVIEVFAKAAGKDFTPVDDFATDIAIPAEFVRKSDILQDKVFNIYHSETEMMRYIKKLERRDISLTHSMIPLGSCTMKLNAASEMLPESFAEFGNIHPFVPTNQVDGYNQMITELCNDLAEITGFAGVTVQPNSGASGEYTGLLVIREYLKDIGEDKRNICIIPASAHGTNPASAAMAGMDIVVVACDDKGNIDMDDLKKKAEEHKDNLAAFMVTYPSTHGVFESRIKEMMDIIHDNGGQVYMDGANMNAQVGLTNPGFIGADVCHLNLHKTFAIPHGGGGPGVGPIGVAAHLVDFLPTNPVVNIGTEKSVKAVSSAPYGSASVLQITYAYIKMLGEEGLRKSTEMAIVNANYMAKRIAANYDILYTGETGRVGHEMIVSCHGFKAKYGVEAADIARRLMDYGFHAPTLSFPVHETLMVEPTESESLQELDRFIDALASIKAEMDEIESGAADMEDNVLKMAPHTADEVTGDEWNHAYSRQKAAYPLEWIRMNKFWPSVGKIDNGYGDRNLICTCAPIEDYM